MSQKNVDSARRGYTALNEAYRTGDINVFRPTAKELWDPGVVLVTAGVLADSDTTAHGVDAVLRFVEHVFTFRGAMAVRVEAHPTKADALEAVGLSE